MRGIVEKYLVSFGPTSAEIAHTAFPHPGNAEPSLQVIYTIVCVRERERKGFDVAADNLGRYLSPIVLVECYCSIGWFVSFLLLFFVHHFFFFIFVVDALFQRQDSHRRHGFFP